MREAASIQPVGLKPGIYFGLDFDIYADDPALNYSGIKSLLQSEAVYWVSSPLNAARKERKKTDAMKFGSALHCLILEPESFSDRFTVVPGQAYQPDKEIIRKTEYDRMQAMAEVIHTMPEKGILVGGAAEATIVWECPSTGIRMKARHDYFCPRWSVDYKTTDSINESSIKNSFWKYGYYIQDYHYRESRLRLKEALRERKAGVFGKMPYGDFIKDLLAGEDDAFAFVFQMGEEPYAAEVFECDMATVGRGATDTLHAVELYCDSLEKYGVGKWPPTRGGVREFSMSFGFNR